MTHTKEPFISTSIHTDGIKEGSMRCLSFLIYQPTANSKFRSGVYTFRKSFLSWDRLCGLVVRVLATDPEARVRFPALPGKGK
jgi:hypothetical protein